MLRILGRPSSINVRKVLWTLDEIGLAYDHDLKDAEPGDPAASPDFLRLNPNGMIPVLQDDDGALWESNTICRYLPHKHGRTDLLPEAPRARAEVEMWMDWQATELNGAWRYAFMALGRRLPDFRDEAAIARSIADWNAMMLILDARLAQTGAYAAGSGFTLADVVLGLSAHRYVSTPFEKPPLPAVDAWMERLAERPAFRTWAAAAFP